jgi:hypothetical protein
MSLRTRLLLSLVGTSAITLAALALALLPPLQTRLRDEARDALKQTVLASRPTLEAELRGRREVSPRAGELLQKLAGQTDARVLLYAGIPFDASAAAVVDTGSGGTPRDDVIRAWTQGVTNESRTEGTVRIAVPIPATGSRGVPD